MANRPFRFGVQDRNASSGSAWEAAARRYEDIGFSVLTLADHFDDQLAPIVAMTAAACATTKLQVGCLVFDNDYRHPVVFAKEMATLDVISGGRVEIGLGAGWMGSDYAEAGMPYDPPGTRVGRFMEGVRVVKALLGEDPVNFSGDYYTITGHNALPKPIQKPHPPIVIGGGGPRILRFAAREADIININPRNLGNERWAETNVNDASEEATDRKIGLVRDAAGERIADIELGVTVAFVIETDDRVALAENIASGLPQVDGQPADPKRVLASPHVLIGTIDEMAATLQERRDRWGFSYITFVADAADAVAPLVQRLAGS
jgi:probable F420-dependent oxidoreductase